MHIHYGLMINFSFSNIAMYVFFFFLFRNYLQELLTETEQLKSSYQEVTTLSKSVISFLSGVHKPSAEAIQAKIDQLDKQYKA